MSQNSEIPALRKQWNDQAKALIGRRIIEARYLTRTECDQQGWGQSALLIVLDDGTMVFPMADDEGNHAGSLMVLRAVQNGGAGRPTLVALGC
jgi:hypothetical protein